MFNQNSKEPEKSIDLTSVTSELEKICLDFISACKKDLTWKWDDRFNMVLAEFNTSKKDEIYSNLKRFSETTWDNQSIHKAPKPIINISKQLGGINPNQLLFVSNSAQEAFLICAWWPWGDGKRISIRLSPSSSRLSEDEKNFLSNHFKTLFGV